MIETPSELGQLIATMKVCRVCRDAPLGKPLPHEPRPIFVASAEAKILIASQAPGIRAHLSGVPFMDPSGVRLRQWLGVDEATFYDPRNFAILPMGFCFPGHDAQKGDLPPRRECAPIWRKPALDLMPAIQLILVIGIHAHQYHLGRGTSMTEMVRNWRAILHASSGPRVLPLPHPSWRNSSWLKKNPWFEIELLPELQAEVENLIAY
ncbi:uracil-DNA glycosylase [Tianweitania populi]|uniref:Uracil-DNA glycosylase n=2 Tax=Tianweitania populi TaxID=1607949 RepID=A0A8J3GJ11_9HYPH|nr:uracil-DNA glycosylase [Tianweitania populi]